ncbi:MAG: helix-turn-helix domain-containing protein [Erysipelotrichaceae bacterium]|nr:helix-turn-helix domain-containing protein [Erysipelotrichaceae bacterium]
MKDIGAKLKEARESIDISIEEAANDLKVTNSQIENIEAGNLEAFQDIFYLKYFIRDYAKYLGLKYDDLVDEFNEYLFDYTSKISLDEIEAAKKEELNKDDKIRSPYTIDYYSKNNIWIYIIIALTLIAVVVLIIIFR